MNVRLSDRNDLAGATAGEARRIIVGGRVQGVGFRPYVYRHARAHRLSGWVRNGSGRVEIHVQGESSRVERFVATLVDCAPPLSRPVLESVDATACCDSDGFEIRRSQADAAVDVHLPPDLFTCDDCLRELNDPADRRYRYPFINCTQCGPRYSLIRALPYDRASTSMAAFPLCAACAAEYNDPANRRYHAEPVACAACGPQLTFAAPGADAIEGDEPALASALEALAAGRILAVKGIGGYHLACDAGNDSAVQRLRAAKPRPHKPLAVMFPAPVADPLAVVRCYLAPNADEARLLASPARPIVTVRRKADRSMSAAIAPGLDEIGAMLPYSPLHHLLLNGYGRPLVMTSANFPGEPVLTERDDVEQTLLARVAEACLHHDRPILHAVDDSLFRVIDGRHRPLRLGRGVAPLEIELPFELDTPAIAVGAQMKNTVTLAWGRRAVISPHLGNMDRWQSMLNLERCVADLQALYQVRAEYLICDAHTGYTTARWARRQGLPVHEVLHHHAHAATAWLDAGQDANHAEQMLAFTWDGVGLGLGGILWGGEAFLGKPGDWRQVATMRPFRPPGGDVAARQPWRSAAALCWEEQLDCPLRIADDPLLKRTWREGRNAPQTTAVGRLFDAAAALCGLVERTSFEGQGPMLLEALAARTEERIDAPPLVLRCRDDVYVADWAPLLPMLMDSGLPAGVRAYAFHEALARTLLQIAQRVRQQTGIDRIGLAGGVFQNRILAQTALDLLREDGFTASLPVMLPVNDAGIACGQVVEFAHRTVYD